MVATELGFEASLTSTRRIELPGKPARVEADMRFYNYKNGPVDGLVEKLSEIRGVVSVQASKKEND